MTFALSAEQPQALSFEQAIAYTEELLSNTNLSDLELQDAITALIVTANGARGFFVNYLTGEWETANHPTTGIIQALQSVPVPTAELLVKNLAMSTAMAITHRRQNNESQAQGSDRVRDRTSKLIELVNSSEIKKIASQMYSSAQQDNGDYVSFLNKWGYDREQKNAIATGLSKFIV